MVQQAPLPPKGVQGVRMQYRVAYPLLSITTITPFGLRSSNGGTGGNAVMRQEDAI